MLVSILSEFSISKLNNEIGIGSKELITFLFKFQVGYLPFVRWFFNYRHSFSNLYIILCAREIFVTSTSSCEASFSTVINL